MISNYVQSESVLDTFEKVCDAIPRTQLLDSAPSVVWQDLAEARGQNEAVAVGVHLVRGGLADGEADEDTHERGLQERREGNQRLAELLEEHAVPRAAERIKKCQTAGQASCSRSANVCVEFSKGLSASALLPWPNESPDLLVEYAVSRGLKSREWFSPHPERPRGHGGKGGGDPDAHRGADDLSMHGARFCNP